MVLQDGSQHITSEAQPTGEGTRADLSDEPKPILGVTGGATAYAFEADIPGATISDDVPGTSVFSYALNSTMGPLEAENLFFVYQYWHIEALVITVKAVSPNATASGSIQVAIDNDPANGFPTKKTDALNLSLSLLGSKQIGARDSVSFTVDISKLSSPLLGQWRYCLGDGRLCSYGTLFAVVRSQPAQGDTAYYSVTLGATLKFMNRTLNNFSTSVSTYADLPEDITWSVIDEKPRSGFNIKMSFTLPADELPASSGTMLMPEPARGILMLTETIDSSTIDETFNFAFVSAQYVATVSTNADEEEVTSVEAIIPVSSGRGSALEAPSISDGYPKFFEYPNFIHFKYEVDSSTGELLKHTIRSKAPQSYGKFLSSVKDIPGSSLASRAIAYLRKSKKKK